MSTQSLHNNTNHLTNIKFFFNNVFVQNMMALPKNYQKYRLEVTKLSVHFDFADDMSTFARSDGGKNSPRSQSGELGTR